jgi:hypothetical protein
MAVSGFAQRKAVFGFSPLQLHNWYQHYGVNSPLPRNSRSPGPRPDDPTLVIVSGNFGGTFNVNGMGTAHSSRNDTYVNITSNRPLTFQTSGFTSLQSGGASASSAGSVGYEIQLYAGSANTVGDPVTAAVSGTDAGFNGKSITLTSDQIPGDNHLTLRISRTLQLTQLARGGVDYTASGTLILTIN